MIYMYALPRALPQYQHAKLAGEVVYPTGTRRVPMGSLHTQFKTDLGALIRRIAADKPAARVPSEARMPLLRHYAERLHRANRDRLSAQRRDHRRLLNPRRPSPRAVSRRDSLRRTP